MKKIFTFLICTMLLTGCGKMDNTPTKKVEAFLSKYQMLDNQVVSELTSTTNNDPSLNQTQKQEYISIMKKHYKNLTYTIKNEEVDGTTAIVKVEINITDNTKVLYDANLYKNTHLNEFNDDKGSYSETKFKDYQLAQLKKASEKVKYTLELKVSKQNNDWVLNTLSTSDLDKINGVYNSNM